MNPSGGGKGRTWPSESRWLHDEATGARIRQVTAHPSIHHHPFFFVPPYDDAPERLCLARASSVGTHWGGPFPYNDGPKEVYAPQHTHPHPRPSPDGKQVLYTSDASGHAQLYECWLEP